MRRHPDFKPTQVFDWASEPADERPTDFGRSTGFSTVSGFATLHEVPASARRRAQQRRGMLRFVFSTTLVLGLSVSALLTMVHYLRAA